ncbi:MAG: nucleotidyltransferase domain-containing protein [Gemmatimonadota bacterium]|nr:nucleotidyltransferase domain-containing protein [Gemmatimonadota bacterium]
MILEKPPVDEVVRTIVDKLRPNRIIVFGSYARGDAGPDSDLDLMVEMESDLPLPERAMRIDDLFAERGWALDVWVYTPEEVRRGRSNIGSLVSIIESEGQVVYER